MREQQRQSFVQVLNCKRKAFRERFHRMHTRKTAEFGFVEGAIALDFNDIGAAELGD